MKINTMKSMVTTLLLMVVIIIGNAQSDLRAFFNSSSTPVTWLGIDYSQAKYFGETGTVDGYEMRDAYTKINNLVLNEPEKFNLNEAFNKDDISIETDYIDERNSSCNAKKIISRGSTRLHRLTYDSLVSIVSSYKLPKKLSGIGIVFIAESFNKNQEKSTFHVVCIDLDSQSILFTERVTGEAGGFGFRNHWGNCVHEVLEDIERNLFWDWKRKYSNASSRS